MQLTSSLRRDLLKLAVTAAVALLGGWLCTLLALPAPYLLGSVFGVWLFGSFAAAVASALGRGALDAQKPGARAGSFDGR